MTLISKVSMLLKKYYPDSPETKSALKLRQNAKRITDLIEDPLLWMRVAYREAEVDRFTPLNAIIHLKLSSLPENKVKEITERRLDVLDAAIDDLDKQGHDLSSLTGKNIGSSERRKTIFATTLSEGRVIRSCTINRIPDRQAELVTESGSNSQCRGVVVDMYPATAAGEEWEGYVVDWEGVHRGEVYKFEIAAIQAGCAVLSIGDIVSFRASSLRVVNSSLRIVEYFPGGLDEDFVRHSLKELVAGTPTSDPVEYADPEGLTSRVLEALPLWKGLLNEERLYRQLYKEILSVYLMWCTVTTSTHTTDVSSSKNMGFLSTLGSCSFIRRLPAMLQIDPRQTHNQETSEFQSFQQDLRTTSRLLRACLPCKASYTLAEAFKCLTELLSKPGFGIEEEMKSLSSSVLNECKAVQLASDTTCMNHLVKQKQASDVTITLTTTTGEQFSFSQDPLQDPLFWLRLLHSNKEIDGSIPAQLLNRNQLARTEEVVKKRLQALAACNVAEMEIKDLSPLLKQYETQAFLREILLPESPEADEDEEESCGPTQEGVISDLYPGHSWKGYIVCPAQSTEAENEFSHVFQFDSTTTANPKSYDLPVHIGDVVAFRPSNANAVQVANATLQVVEFFPGVLNEATALPCLNVVKRAPNNIEALHEILQYPAVWKYLLNEPSIYRKHYQAILGIYKTDDSTTIRLHQKLMRTLKDSSFIQELVALLEGDTRPPSDEQYRKDVCASTQLLLTFAQCVPSSAHTIVEPLKQLTELLSKLGMHQELKTLVIAIIDNYLIPPDSEKVRDRPWKYIPTILTRQEIEECINFAPSKHNPIDLPVVKDYGRYESPEEYGQTYFNLLRADCYEELIDTIAHLKTQHNDECHDCKFYYVTYLGLTKGIGHRIVYTLEYETTIPLERAGSSDELPPLRQGDLVCFSIGGKFENDLVWATVNGSEQTSFMPVGNTLVCKQGRLQVELCSEANDCPDEKVMELFSQSKNTVAVESPAYFRAYQPVLEALKRIDFSKIHFIGDLLKPSCDIKSEPEIIDDSSEVDVLHLYYPDKQPDEPHMSVVKLKAALASDKIEETCKFCLDRSQREAVFNALSQPLSVIQGPPGTGKTYIALKLLQLFLPLSTLPKDKPIIIMAYKNRALDHILEECKKFCPHQQIVRIGHVSEDYKHLDELTLRQRAYGGARSFFLKQFRRLYKRVKMAVEEMEKRSKLSMENCLPSMSPQWLKSLLLDIPMRALSNQWKQKISSNPQKYLHLLMEHTVMGKQDKGEKSEVKQALTEAWDLWTSQNPELHSPPPKVAKVCSLAQLDDFEEKQDYEAIEEDRCMAADDDPEDESVCHVLKSGIALSESFLDTMTQGTVRVDDNHVWNLTPEQRKQLIENTVYKHYREGMKYLKDCLREYNEVREEYELERQQQYLEVLKRARVVGMTTTGAAIHQELLNKLKAPVVFVEEAAEVLESNLLAILTPHVKHLVLIGDHNQLKPQVASHKLAKHHKFNTSMFERLVKNNFPYTLLMRQSRMHPQFVELFSCYYTEQRKEAGRIESSKRVHGYQHPSCMASPIFWWSYSDKSEEKRGSSITNQHEAQMVAALCLWLLSQQTKDEKTQRIQVLTPYRAQFAEISKALEESANQLTSGQLRSVVPRTEIKVSTVDEFQGHESDIIILCLVRSNRKKQIGFLREKTRLVVGISRQKCGLYIIGNDEFLKETSTFLWKPFIERVEKLKGITLGYAIPIMFEGKQYNCHSPEELLRVACNPEKLSCVQDAEGHQQPDKLESDSPAKGSSSSSAVTTPLNSGSQAIAPPLRQQSSPAALNFLETNERFRQIIMDLQKTAAVQNRKNIGRRLGVYDHDIDRIGEENKNDPNEAFYRIMMKWYQKEGKAATPKKLIDALYEEDLNNVAQIVTSKVQGLLEW